MHISTIRDRVGLFKKRNNDGRTEDKNDQDHNKKQTESTSHFPNRNVEIRSELEQILSSEFFRNSKRCQDFLNYIVESACLETTDELKERTLGVMIFGRVPDYDTGTDAIVRVKASEVRRRLAQYNLTAASERPITIELHPGSYVPHIRKKPLAKPLTYPPPDKIAEGPGLKFIIPLVSAILVLVFSAVIYTNRSPVSPLMKFWEPYLHQPQPVICTAFPSIYTRIPSTIKDVSDTHTAFLIEKQLRDFGRSSRVAVADDIEIADLKQSPVVLIGGPRANRWTMSMTKDLRFGFETVNNKRRIVDRLDAARFWENRATSVNGDPLEDYVLITRLIHSSSGQAMVSIAGITARGGQAAGELITNASLLQKTLKNAPDGWEHKNLQLVLRTHIIKGKPRPPELAASIYW